jgi:hypothetical protein
VAKACASCCTASLKAGPFDLTSVHIAATFPASIVVDVTWQVIPAVDASADEKKE